MASVYVYRYFGMVLGHVKSKVALISASMQEIADHAAVWTGVNQSDNKSWVQGGVLIDWTNTTKPDHPSAYIEVMPLHQLGSPPVGYKLLQHPVKWGIPVQVKLTRSLTNRRMWTCKVTGVDRDGKNFTITSPKVNIPHPGVDSVLETLGNVQAKALIDGRIVTTKGKPDQEVAPDG